MRNTLFLINAPVANTKRIEEGINCSSIDVYLDGFAVDGLEGFPEGTTVQIPWSNVSMAVHSTAEAELASPTNSTTTTQPENVKPTPPKRKRRTSKK